MRLGRYGWAQHDGRRYGRQVRPCPTTVTKDFSKGPKRHVPRGQVIEDKASKVGLVTEFVRLDGEKGDWAARVTLKETEAPKAADEVRTHKQVLPI